MKSVIVILLAMVGGFTATLFKHDPILLGIFMLLSGYLIGRL
ncbi:hypothetical protein HWD12_gp106 [Phage NBSal003]|uniref:Uncharacterized protein n=1 Tax=Phage NBSal003 TaxID=2991864 RepID=A0A6G8QYR7_9CAUD|nr:hypothetical protein HWD12_gp004 [Phage NBSal003]YP_009857148.1 hypothetical protein HWD12_gp106 [Phage NBSal003]QIN92773.1 hypothetical protein [Phage NBSal003]QIN92928.1 hypothetical protein [Phage NBSal003]